LPQDEEIGHQLYRTGLIVRFLLATARLSYCRGIRPFVSLSDCRPIKTAQARIAKFLLWLPQGF